MSFDIFFQTTRFTGKTIVVEDPFTGKSQTVAEKEPLSIDELEAVHQVFLGIRAQAPDENGCYIVELDDGGEAEVYGEDLKSGCMVSLRQLTPQLSLFLFDLLKAGNWSLLPAMDDAVAITASPGNTKGVPGELTTCNSAKELDVLLSKGVKAWQKYRNQVARDG